MLETPLLCSDLKPLLGNKVGLAVLGWPIKHSISPDLHNSALSKLAIEKPEYCHWSYSKIEVESSKLKEVLPKLWEYGYQGLNLTIPHKVEVLPLLETIEPSARVMGAVNTLVRSENGWSGLNTDGYGLECGLKENLDVSISASEILLLGAGGAARATAAQCLKGGCSKLWIGNRSAGRLNEMVAILEENFGKDRIHPFLLSKVPSRLHEVDDLIIINSTSLGLKETDDVPFDLHQVSENCRVYDMIYNPSKTKFLETAEARNLLCSNGLSMLVHQAVRSLEHWTNEKISLQAMYQGAHMALGKEHR